MSRDPKTRESVLSPIIDRVLAEQYKWRDRIDHLTESGVDNPLPRIQELGWEKINKELEDCVYPPTNEERMEHLGRVRPVLNIDSSEDPALPGELAYLLGAAEVTARVKANARFFELLNAKPGSIPANAAFGYWTVRQVYPALAAEAEQQGDEDKAETITKFGCTLAKMLEVSLSGLADIT